MEVPVGRVITTGKISREVERPSHLGAEVGRGPVIQVSLVEGSGTQAGGPRKRPTTSLVSVTFVM